MPLVINDENPQFNHYCKTATAVFHRCGFCFIPLDKRPLAGKNSPTEIVSSRKWQVASHIG
ncbi:MAG: hypothetical protein KDE56_14330 [Anaerolineales bacterium]|nr:hypothetical protein [Anaerolineales bacterium]